MKIDVDNFLLSIEKRPGHGQRINMYLDSELWKQFREMCGMIPPSRVVEQFLRDFVRSKKKKK